MTAVKTNALTYYRKRYWTFFMVLACILGRFFTSVAIVVCCSVGKLKTLTDRSRQTCAQFKKDKRANLSYNESQVHKYDKFVELFIFFFGL